MYIDLKSTIKGEGGVPWVQIMKNELEIWLIEGVMVVI